MSETGTTIGGRPWALCRTVEAYSGGTRVEIVHSDPHHGRVEVRVIATDEVIEVRASDLVQLRSGVMA